VDIGDVVFPVETVMRDGMGWLRLVGSLKLYVSFVAYSLFNRALSQKRPIILRSLLIVATPYAILVELTSMTWSYCNHETIIELGDGMGFK